jgi:hypothetical protein
MAAGAFHNIFEVLESGMTMEAGKNVAAEIYRLSMINDCKVQIGASSKAMLSLVGLLKESTSIGIRDTDTALFTLAAYDPKKLCMVKAILMKTKCVTHEIKHVKI